MDLRAAADFALAEIELALAALGEGGTEPAVHPEMKDAISELR
jgi:hypothetical protein